MTKIDQFESVFNAASKPVFSFEKPSLKKILVLSDQKGESHQAFRGQVEAFLEEVEDEKIVHDVTGEQFSDVQQLLDITHEINPDMICTYRNLHTNTWQWPYSIGDYLDVLTQETNIPILVLPHPKKEGKEWHPERLQEVMAITNDLTGDDRLVNYALCLTPSDGKLFMSHVEDQVIFEHYVDMFSKIPEIDTDIARETVLARLLKEPEDYVASCQEILKEQGIEIELKALVSLGHFLSDYQKQIQEYGIDLLVLNTKDDDQLAMHGLAYPIAVEFRSLPLLML